MRLLVKIFAPCFYLTVEHSLVVLLTVRRLFPRENRTDEVRYQFDLGTQKQPRSITLDAVLGPADSLLWPSLCLHYRVSLFNEVNNLRVKTFFYVPTTSTPRSVKKSNAFVLV